jgi:hypothetical protein
VRVAGNERAESGCVQRDVCTCDDRDDGCALKAHNGRSMCPLYAFHAQSGLMRVDRTHAGRLGVHDGARVCAMVETASVHERHMMSST